MSGLKKEFVTQRDLNEMAQEKNSIRVGSTVDPQQRAYQYQAEGYAGTMFVAKTANMLLAEDKLLEHQTRHNVHMRSNAPNDEGFVYVIKGRKMR
ncbi:unnamed protein product [Brachionus calyciflorus]|uniref:Uncharacterized protein n=1 Tax=Brachionus calyciflorus TaxID=104777 RepID=A0A814FK08_9BILA|nr:unnamed protein product [Brachionus calyciflorus]